MDKRGTLIRLIYLFLIIINFSSITTKQFLFTLEQNDGHFLKKWRVWEGRAG